MKRVNILGVGVSPINLPLAIEIIEGWIARRASQYVCVTGVHGIIESQRSPEIRQIHNEAGLVTPDGMPLVWVSRIKGYPQVSRVYGPDLMLALCGVSALRSYRHYLYGGQEGVPELLSRQLVNRYPGLNIVGVYSPPFRPLTPEEDLEIVTRINACEPDIVWVGMSTPKQEIWMASHVNLIKRSILIGVGAAFDFHAGIKPQAPEWMQKNGMEWVFRLLTEPRRLGPRYLVNNPLFILLVLGQFLGMGGYDLFVNDEIK